MTRPSSDPATAIKSPATFNCTGMSANLFPLKASDKWLAAFLVPMPMIEENMAKMFVSSHLKAVVFFAEL